MFIFRIFSQCLLNASFEMRNCAGELNVVTIFVCSAALKSHHVSGRQKAKFARRCAYLEDSVEKKKKRIGQLFSTLRKLVIFLPYAVIPCTCIVYLFSNHCPVSIAFVYEKKSKIKNSTGQETPQLLFTSQLTFSD